MQRIPITLTATPVPVGIEYSDINQLLTIAARYLAGQISDSVTFVLTGATDPTDYVTDLFYNTTQRVWKSWDVGSGRYLASTQFQPGDTKTSFLSGDQIQQGWVQLDGREISAIEGISQNQAQVLTTLFGIGGSLPNVAPLTSLSGMPSDATIASIPVENTTPPDNQIGNLPFGSSYDPAQSQALATNTETLRDSTASLRQSVAQIKEKLGLTVASLNQGSTGAAPLYSFVFVGYP